MEICCNQKLGTVYWSYWTDDDNKAHTGFKITIIIARLSISEYINSYMSQWIRNNRDVAIVYSTDDELWQQEILVTIGYNKTIMSMSDDFGK